MIGAERNRAVLDMGHIRAENENLRARLAEYGRAIKAYDNQYTLPFRKPMIQKINAQKREERKKNNSTGRRGRPTEHKGVPASRKADDIVRRTPDRCGLCGGMKLKTVKVAPEMRTDVLPPPVPLQRATWYRRASAWTAAE